jgi:hypothetical protein
LRRCCTTTLSWPGLSPCLPVTGEHASTWRDDSRLHGPRAAHCDGLFAASQDADTDSVEGGTYVWTVTRSRLLGGIMAILLQTGDPGRCAVRVRVRRHRRGQLGGPDDPPGVLSDAGRDDVRPAPRWSQEAERPPHAAGAARSRPLPAPDDWAVPPERPRPGRLPRPSRCRIGRPIWPSPRERPKRRSLAAWPRRSAGSLISVRRTTGSGLDDYACLADGLVSVRGHI